MHKYSVVIQWSDEDKAYVAAVPELPGLSALGSTAAKAMKELTVAQELYVSVLAKKGALPEPDKLVLFSGQIRVRLPKSLHASLSHEARKEGVSLNTHIIKLLSERDALKKVENKIDKMETERRHVRKLSLVTRAEASTIVTEASNNPWAEEKRETKITPSFN